MILRSPKTKLCIHYHRETSSIKVVWKKDRKIWFYYFKKILYEIHKKSNFKKYFKCGNTCEKFSCVFRMVIFVSKNLFFPKFLKISKVKFSENTSSHVFPIVNNDVPTWLTLPRQNSFPPPQLQWGNEILGFGLYYCKNKTEKIRM